MSAVSPAPEIVVVQTTIPAYRTSFFESLSRMLGQQLLIVSGDEDFALDLEHVDRVPHAHARNRFLAGRRLLWQSGVLERALDARVAVLVLNPRVLSTWIVVALRRLKRRRTILWGHAWPRHGMRSRTDRLRGVMRGLAGAVIVYTETEARQLRDYSDSLEVVAAPNALYSRRELDPSPPPDTSTDFVFVGRLNRSKKPDLLLDAFRRAQPDLDRDVRLVFVGDGPLRVQLETTARHLGLSDRVIVCGQISAIDDLRRIYARAIASVSPGYAGLSLIQSLGFGVPMLIAREEPHAPEIEAAVEGENAWYFPSNSPEALASTLISVAKERDDWLSRRPAIAAPIRDKYCIETMVASFVAALRLDEASRVVRL
jgi:glycosyltransferase involved in cell wall biosynthesis